MKAELANKTITNGALKTELDQLNRRISDRKSRKKFNCDKFERIMQNKLMNLIGKQIQKLLSVIYLTKNLILLGISSIILYQLSGCVCVIASA